MYQYFKQACNFYSDSVFVVLSGYIDTVALYTTASAAAIVTRMGLAMSHGFCRNIPYRRVPHRSSCDPSSEMCRWGYPPFPVARLMPRILRLTNRNGRRPHSRSNVDLEIR